MYQEQGEGTLEGTLPVIGILSMEGGQVEEEGTIQTGGLLFFKTNHPQIHQLEEGEEEWTSPTVYTSRMYTIFKSIKTTRGCGRAETERRLQKRPRISNHGTGREMSLLTT